MGEKRINRCIELLEQGEYLYYTGAGPLTYENGKKQAKTWADFLMVDYEHSPFDVVGLRAFMQGLVDGGPTNSGHRTPTVFATLPSNCRTVQEVRANAWQIRHVLSSGVHGILHTHARQADAVRAFVEECRYPFQTAGLDHGLVQGSARGRRSGICRGYLGSQGAGVRAGSRSMASESRWGVDAGGLKLRIESALQMPSIYARCRVWHLREWGPGDMGMSYGFADAHDPPYPPIMEEARSIVKGACDDNGIHFLCSWKDSSKSAEENIRFLMDWGVRILSGGGEDQARIGRAISGRQMPV